MLIVGWLTLLGLKSLTDCVMTLVAYGSFEICNTAIHLIVAERSLSASDGIIEGLAAKNCSGESDIGLPASLHSQMARDLPQAIG